MGKDSSRFKIESPELTVQQLVSKLCLEVQLHDFVKRHIRECLNSLEVGAASKNRSLIKAIIVAKRHIDRIQSLQCDVDTVENTSISQQRQHLEVLQLFTKYVFMKMKICITQPKNFENDLLTLIRLTGEFESVSTLRRKKPVLNGDISVCFLQLYLRVPAAKEEAVLSEGGQPLAPHPPTISLPPLAPPWKPSSSPPPPAPPSLPQESPGPPPLPPPQPLLQTPRKCIPEPTRPLKSFHWSKLSESKIQGTVWEDLDETPLYSKLNLKRIDKHFFDKSGDKKIKQPKKMSSVLNNQRAQGCEIFLRQLKIAPTDIIKTISNMDQEERISVEVIEQLLRYVPTAEEQYLLKERKETFSSFTTADDFVYKTMQVPHYQKMLKCLLYKKQFQSTLDHVKKCVEDLFEASSEVYRSQLLRQLLEIILAVGNYMNRGPKGNASGFRISSLQKLVDTKGTNNITLLHYLVKTVEKHFEDVLGIANDLQHVEAAAKVSSEDLDNNIKELQGRHKGIQEELLLHHDEINAANSKFLSIMTEFLATSSSLLIKVNSDYGNMKCTFEKSLHFFGEDTTSDSEEFFGYFNTFLKAFQGAQHDVKKSQSTCCLPTPKPLKRLGNVPNGRTERFYVQESTSGQAGNSNDNLNDILNKFKISPQGIRKQRSGRKRSRIKPSDEYRLLGHEQYEHSISLPN